jgi:hypothetical protein
MSMYSLYDLIYNNILKKIKLLGFIPVVKKFECEKEFSYTISQVSKKVPQDGMTLRSFLKMVGERGRLITCMILAAPFLLPISIPGTGVVVGFIVLFISLSIMFDKIYLVPEILLKREMSHVNLIKILNVTFKMLKYLERYMKPRLLVMTNKKFSKTSNNIFLVISSFFFILPIPIPLTDTLPAFGIFFLSAGILECDGYLILTGYLVVILTALYFSAITILGLKFLFNYGFYFRF